mmetsp:Transcript_89772/g.231773  ORF Transcript_89772/g.231773 Transcript_89772/m.231773 type:complete len:772 (+) Transcript_89772:92-2407(+)
MLQGCCVQQREPVHLEFDIPSKGEANLRSTATQLSEQIEQLKKLNAELRSSIGSKRASSKKLRASVPEKTGNSTDDATRANSKTTPSMKGEPASKRALEIIKLSKSESSLNGTSGHLHSRPKSQVIDSDMNVKVLEGSALTKGALLQALIYTMAFGGVVFVLAAKATSSDDEAHRRLGGGASKLMVNISYCVAIAGCLAFFFSFIKQPMMLGYLLSGVLLGPQLLDIVHSHEEISDVSALGTIFLLFMIGLELDLSELFKMGRVVITTGLLQYPFCALITWGIFILLQAAGMNFGEGRYAALYCGTTTAISSTVLVVKLLSMQADMDSAPGKLTVNILIFQDLWAIVLFIIQTELSDPQPLNILGNFGMVAVLVVIALLYAKFVIPAVLLVASHSVELMLIISLAWCFFMCCFATLPFIGLSAELAALISGVALATFPYSAEFNLRIKYIRDFFITLFLAGIGVQLPAPTWETIGTVVVVVLVVLIVRWIGIFLIVWALGGGGRSAGLSTINLSQISEIALVLCSLGIKPAYNHIGDDTLKIITWSFAVLFVLATLFIRYNYVIYGFLARTFGKVTGIAPIRALSYDGSGEDDGMSHADRDIVLLGFHKVAAMLVAHFERHNPHLLEKLHVIDFTTEWTEELRERGITSSVGDISDPDVLRNGYRGDARLVISSIPDTLLLGTDNKSIMEAAREVWPRAHVIVAADNQKTAHELYVSGADYVLRMAKLCAERLHVLIADHCSHLVHRAHAGDEIATQVFEQYRVKDKDRSS